MNLYVFVVLTVFNVKETLKKNETKVSATHIKHDMVELGIANVISCEKIGKPQKRKVLMKNKFSILNLGYSSLKIKIFFLNIYFIY